ncbi:MAG: Halocyanin precursor [Methanoregula sp. PtaU1.Bin051]|nr:MAG: Halocyanin precursor [Methanoregula sp. PtaU1.Bin051]
MKNFAFSPATITVKPETTVTWTNEDSAIHTIVADSGAFASDILGTGPSFRFTFSTAGTYTYHCSIHPSMKGTVIVQP